jgi:hypothetical protein
MFVYPLIHGSRLVATTMDKEGIVFLQGTAFARAAYLAIWAFKAAQIAVSITTRLNRPGLALKRVD